jgi:hypothetical protein
VPLLLVAVAAGHAGGGWDPRSHLNQLHLEENIGDDAVAAARVFRKKRVEERIKSSEKPREPLFPLCLHGRGWASPWPARPLAPYLPAHHTPPHTVCPVLSTVEQKEYPMSYHDEPRRGRGARSDGKSHS